MPNPFPCLPAAATSVALVGLLACNVPSEPGVDPGAVPLAESGGDRGAFLYQRLCAGCHGARGGADALPAGALAPPPRDFSAGLFKLASTVNGVPSDIDLRQTISRGMPGTAMPGFAWLDAADLDHLVGYVRALAVSELAQRLMREAEAIGDALSEAEALQNATEALTPGAPVPVPRPTRANPALLSRGKQLFLSRCAACHGEQGTGQRPIASWAGRLTIQWARDFTAGVFKGPVSNAALAHRIQAGMPASAMPPNSFDDPGELAALIAYVRTLIPDGANDRLVQRRQSITARRIQEPAPRDPDHPAWQRTAPARLVLSPFVWRDASILGAEVRAVHDGVHLSILLSWADPTRDVPAPGSKALPDAAALEFSDEEVPVFFGMGSRRHPVNIWYWRTQSPKQATGGLDTNARLEGAPRTDVPLDSAAGRRPLPRAAALVAHGHASARDFGSQDRTLTAVPRWRDGRWTLLVQRTLRRPGPGQVEFRPGTRLRVALAIWNGALAQRNTDKSFTIWHELVVE